MPANAVALDPAYRRVDVDEFLDMDFGDAKAELDDGLIYMMSGGAEAHARIAGNILAYLHPRLRGTGCRPYNSDFATRTAERSVRYPDMSVYSGNPASPGNEGRKLLGDPQVVVEVLSPSTASFDQKVKLEEYRALDGVREVLLVDPRGERVRIVRRDPSGEWHDRWLAKGAAVEIPSLGLAIPHAEIFARD